MDSGKKIKEARTQKNMSQIQLAELLGITQPSLAAIESGKRTPKIETLIRIAAALDVPALSLLPSEITAGSVKLSPEDSELLSLIEELNPEGKKKVKTYTEDIAKIPEYRSSKYGL